MGNSLKQPGRWPSYYDPEISIGIERTVYRSLNRPLPNGKWQLFSPDICVREVSSAARSTEVYPAVVSSRNLVASDQLWSKNNYEMLKCVL